MKKWSTRKIVLVGMLIGLALVLEFLSDRLLFFKMPQGGSVTLSAIPIIILGCILGWQYGLIGGILIGVLQAIFSTPYVVAPIQYVLDYPLAFGLMGIGALFMPFAKNKKQETIALVFGIIIAMGLRYLSHVLSGVYFFPEYAEGNPVWLYSLGYNLPYMLVTCIATVLVTIPLYVAIKPFKEKFN